jgi:peptidoglycan/LPS O-acetylase OafA/YrhL
VAHLTVGLAAALFVLPFTHEAARGSAHGLARVLAGRTMGWLGTISYGLYLWQLPVIVVLLGHPVDYGTPVAGVVRAGVLVVAVAAGTIACAAASWYLVERPLMYRRTRVPRPRPAAARA